MVRKIVQIRNPEGLKARPAAMFVQSACRFQAQILIEMGNKKINAKSIMGVLSLGVKSGDKVQIVATGEDEKDAVTILASMIESELGA